jgi:hypothetical protein
MWAFYLKLKVVVGDHLVFGENTAFGPKKNYFTNQLQGLHNEKLYDLYMST